MIQKDGKIDLTAQLIENFNAQSRIVIEINKLLNKDWDSINISKDQKKSLRNELTSYVKVAKTTSRRCANCLDRIEQTWNVANQNRFAQLHYFKSSKTFFCYITTVVKLSLTLSRWQKVIRKLDNIVIAQLTINNRPNILGNIYKFNTAAD